MSWIVFSSLEMFSSRLQHHLTSLRDIKLALLQIQIKKRKKRLLELELSHRLSKCEISSKARKTLVKNCSG